MTRLPAAIAIIAVLLCGVVHGFWTDRWGVAGKPAEAAARLTEIATELEDWQSRDLDLDQRQLGPVSGYLHRRYVNRRTGDAVTLFMICGRPGPISIHTPDVCYSANGFEVATPVKYAAPSDSSLPGEEFWTAGLQKKKATEQTNLRIFWAWNATGSWMAADNPRVTFARQPFLYKLYLLHELATPEQPLEEDPSIDFMRLLLPELRRALFPGA